MFFTENALFHFVAFINGGIFGFDGFWLEAEPGIRRTAKKVLRRKQVVDQWGRVDANAVSEVEDMVMEKLIAAARRKGPAVFSPDKSHNSPAGLSKWMQKIVANCVTDYCQKFHGDRPDLKNVSLDGLELNPASPSSVEGDEVVDGAIRLENIEFVRNCLAELGENERFLLMQVYCAGKSQGDLADDIGVHPSKAFRMINAARQHLRRIMVARRPTVGGDQRPAPASQSLAG